MPVLTKCIYEEAEEQDGARILVTRYWPRGLNSTTIDVWCKYVAPSGDLLHAYKEGLLSWDDFETAYRRQMLDPLPAWIIKCMAKIAEQATMTLLCYEETDEHCHRRILQELIEAEILT